MLTYLTLSLVLAAPAPATKPTQAGVTDSAPPQIIEVQAAGMGKVKIPVTRATENNANGNGKIVVNGGGIVVNGNANGGGVVVIGPGAGGPAGNVVITQQQVSKVEFVELTEVKDLKIRNVAGKELSTEEAIKQLATGGLVIAPADGKKIDPKYLKLFTPDVLILSSPELVAPKRLPSIREGNFNIAIPAMPIAPLPAPVPVPAPAIKIEKQ